MARPSKEHPYVNTVGPGPYKYEGLFILQKPSVENGGRDNYRDIPKGSGVGTCQHCGTGIIYNYLIKTPDGHLHAIGSECIKKLALPYIELSKFEKEKAAEMKAIAAEGVLRRATVARPEIERLLKEHANFLRKKDHGWGRSWYEYTTFCLKNMGNAKLPSLLKYLKKAIEEK